MSRFPFVPRSFFALALLLPAAAAAQPAPDAGAGTPPAAPAAPAPGITPPPGAGPAPPLVAPAPAVAPPTGPTIDRGSLLAPAPAPRPAAPPAAPTTDRTTDVSIGANPKDVYAEDWWVHSRPIFEMHGYLRVRAELFHGFALGRTDSPGVALWPQPADNTYTDLNGLQHEVRLCGDSHVALCEDKTQAGANMRFRINPELHISDNLRILSQIDMLDNLVLGTTPGGFANQPAALGGYQPTPGSPYVPLGSLATTTAPPTTGINSFPNSIQVKRAWGEYATPLGQLRFGRMPTTWGLGIFENSGDTYDSDWQSTYDRIMFTTGIKSLDLYFSGTWDFPNEGATSATVESLTGGQPYDLAQLDDVNQYTAMIARRRNREMTKLDLAHGDVVLNGGAFFQYRDQYLAPKTTAGTSNLDSSTLGGTGVATGSNVLAETNGVRRGLKMYVPDLWVQLLYKKFRFEAEGVLVAGSLDSVLADGGGLPSNLRQWGLATQTELKAMEDRLRLNFGFGWASGDNGLIPPNGTKSTLSPSRLGSNAGASTLLPRNPGDSTYREFRFHPDYRIDLILNRNILGRVQGEYYLRPSVDYDFTRSLEGQKLGGGAAVIWSRTSSFIQSPGHKSDLGIELDFSLYYQSKDGSLNDNPDKMGGFFTMLQYGVLFPLGGLGYLPNETAAPDTSTAHMLRWYIGVLY